MRLLGGLLVILAVVLCPARADALTLRDIVELHRSGLGDDVLEALIEAHQRVFTLDLETMKSLKADGLSDRVLIAIINSGRKHLPEPVPVAAAPEPIPTVVVIEHHSDPHPPSPQVIVQQVPVYVPVPVQRASQRRVVVDHPSTPASPFYTGHVREPAPRKAPEQVYWGFGGKLRPDAWQPAPTPERGKDRDRDGDKDKDRKPSGRR